MSTTEKEFLAAYNIHDYDVPLTSVDMSIFSIIDHQLNVLLVKRSEHPSLGEWSLPGGFVDLKNDHSLDDTAHRNLLAKTGISSPYLEQIESIGNTTRDPRGWSTTVLYFALIDIEKVRLNESSEETQWSPVNQARQNNLAFDHNELLYKAVERLKSKTCYTALPIALLPEEFTLTELQQIFETILDKTLQTKSFRRRVLSARVVEPTGGNKQSGKRTALLYKSTGLTKEFYFPRPLQL